MKRQKKRYSRPRKLYDKVRIDEENILKDIYGLKNKREIWKAEAAIGRIRNQAKSLITATAQEKNEFIARLAKKGFKVETIADALALSKENLLKRRLQTLVHSRGFANTPKQARQLIVHKHVAIGDQVVNIPSYHVALEEETLITTHLVLKNKSTKKSKIEEIKESMEESPVENEMETVMEDLTAKV